MRHRIFATLAAGAAILPLSASGFAASTVNCNQGQSLAAAVAAAAPGAAITFSGTCAGPLEITQSLTLSGASSSGIDGGGVADGVTISGAHNVTLQDFGVRNAVTGVVLEGGASAALTNLTVADNSFENVLVTGDSTASLTSLVLGGAPVNGLDVESTSSVIFSGQSFSTGALAFGVDIGTGSSITLTGATLLVHGNGLGIQIGIGASGFIDPASSLIALNNTTTGITVVSGSHLVNFGGRMETANNGIDGFSADSKSGIDLDAGSLLSAHNNVNDGVHLEETSELDMFNTTAFSGVPGNSTLLTQNNGGAGIGVHGNSEFHMHNQVLLNSTGNAGGGATADDGSAIILVQSNLTQNTGADVALTFGSRGDISASKVGTLSCDSSSLLRGGAGFSCPTP